MSTTSSATAQYSYDELGTLRSVVLANGDVIEYVIDGQNRRIAKKVNGAVQYRLVYKDQLEPVAMVDGAGAVLQRYVYGTKSHVPDYVLVAGVRYRIVSDHLGSVRMVVNTSTGAVVQRMDYDEFGRVLADTAPGWQPFGYAGGIVDGDTGLVRFGARDYDAQIGRWTAKDPIRFDGGQNHFEYVYGDPINFIDLTGEQAVGGMPPGGLPGGVVNGYPPGVENTNKLIEDLYSNAENAKNLAKHPFFERTPPPLDYTPIPPYEKPSKCKSSNGISYACMCPR